MFLNLFDGRNIIDTQKINGRMLALSRENEMTHKDYFSFSLWIFAYQVNGVSKYMWSMQHNNRHRHKTVSFILRFWAAIIIDENEEWTQKMSGKKWRKMTFNVEFLHLSVIFLWSDVQCRHLIWFCNIFISLDAKWNYVCKI